MVANAIFLALKEEFLHYLWKNKLLHFDKLLTNGGEDVHILHPGQENMDAGPDFLAAKVQIGSTLWAGHVEIHVKSSQWNQHGHHEDSAYDNVVLHVVYEHDKDIRNHKGSLVPVVEVKGRFAAALLHTYQGLMASKDWVPCQGMLSVADPSMMFLWLGRLATERLERKSEEILQYLEYFQNDWDQTLYFFLARNFGFMSNGFPMGLVAQRTPLKLILRSSDKLLSVEALLFGQAGMLSPNKTDRYLNLLYSEYEHLRSKYNLHPIEAHLWKFSKLRPQNFPTIRLSQFAQLLTNANSLFRIITESKQPEDVFGYFKLSASEYWDTHYTFEKESFSKKKSLGIEAVYNILINTLCPMMFVYGRQTMNSDLNNKALEFLAEIPPEVNSIVNKWSAIGIKARNALDTQALLELKKQYCTPKKCLRCAIGNGILKKGRHPA